MDFSIQKATFIEDTIVVRGESAKGIANFIVKDRGEVLSLSIPAEYKVEEGFTLYREELRIQKLGEDLPYEITDNQFKKMCRFGVRPNKLPNLSTLLQDEIFGHSVAKVKIEEDSVDSFPNGSSCYVCFTLGDKGILGMEIRYSPMDGIELDKTTYNHVDEDMYPTNNEEDFMYSDRLFLMEAKRAGVENILKVVIGGRSLKAPVVKTSKKPSKKKKD